MKTSMKSALLTATMIGFAALPAVAQQGNGGQLQQRFEDVKAKILQRLKEGEACVEASTDFETLAQCKPRGGPSGGRMGGGDGAAPGNMQGDGQDNDQDGGESRGNSN